MIFSVGPIAEAAIVGWLSALSFPIGVAIAARVQEPEKYRSLVAVLLAFASGAVIASVMMEIFGASIQSYMERAHAEAALAATHPDDTQVQLMAAESGDPSLVDDETAYCAKVRVFLVCIFAPIGAVSYLAAHKFALSRVPTKNDNQKLALSVILGQLVDGIPEAALIGLFTVRHELSLVLFLSLAISNLPEAISVTLLHAFPTEKVALIWTCLFIATGLLSAATAAISLAVFPTMHGNVGDDYAFATLEGLAGGAMLVVVTGQYMPDAAEKLKAATGSEAMAGVPLILGIVAAALAKTLGGTVSLGSSFATLEEGIIDLPNLTTQTTPLVSWGVGGAVMPEFLSVRSSPVVHGWH